MAKTAPLTPLGAAMAHLQLGKFSQRAAGQTTAKRPDRRAAAVAAGARGTSAQPLSNATRAGNYRTQNAGGKAKFCAQLTPAQARRLRKKSKTLEGHAQAARAGAYDRSSAALTGTDRDYASPVVTAGRMTGPEYDRMRAAQVAVYARVAK